MQTTGSTSGVRYRLGSGGVSSRSFSFGGGTELDGLTRGNRPKVRTELPYRSNYATPPGLHYRVCRKAEALRGALHESRTFALPMAWSRRHTRYFARLDLPTRCVRRIVNRSRRCRSRTYDPLGTAHLFVYRQSSASPPMDILFLRSRCVDGWGLWMHCLGIGVVFDAI